MNYASQDYFIVDGHKVELVDGYAIFHKFGVNIKMRHNKEFSYGWVLKMNAKLSKIFMHA